MNTNKDIFPHEDIFETLGEIFAPFNTIERPKPKKSYKKMNISYLRNARSKRYTYYVKVMNNEALIVTDDQILFETFDESRESHIGWYKDTDSFQLVDATKEEFDAHFIKTVKKINELSKL